MHSSFIQDSLRWEQPESFAVSRLAGCSPFTPQGRGQQGQDASDVRTLGGPQGSQAECLRSPQFHLTHTLATRKLGADREA